MSSKQFCLKYNIKTEHWVGYLQLRSRDTNAFFKMTPVVDDIQASVTVNTIEQSDSEGGKNPIFLQESEDANNDTGVNAEENKSMKTTKHMVVSIEEEQKTLEYQETMKLDVENIANNNNNKWILIYEVIDNSCFAAKNIF